MKKILPILSLAFICQACYSPVNNTNPDNDNTYAGKFRIEEFNAYRTITVYDPWQRSSGEKLTYILAKDITGIPDSLKNFPVIQIPVSRVAVFSTTHIGFIEALGESEGITGVSGLKYVCNEIVKERAGRKKVFDVGYPPGINYERLIDLSPDVVFLYGIESSVAGISARLEKAGIPCFILAEYLEAHPLGKMEWIKIFGHFYGKEELAAEIFKKAGNEYEALKELTGTIEDKPFVLTGMPWKDTWHMSGGQSYTSKLISDAGGKYLWSENNSSENIPLSLEAVMPGAMKADLWINTGSASSLSEIANRDPRFTKFNVFKNGNLYNNDALVCESGGNPFWEKGVTEPHLILKDLIKIFHPNVLPEYDFVYYRKLE